MKCSYLFIAPDNDPPKNREFVYDENGNLKKDKEGEPLTVLQDIFPLPSDSPSGANSALQLIDEINQSSWGRLFGSPLKTFEYDLAIEKNTSQMVKVLHDLWPSSGTIKKRCNTILLRNNHYEGNEQFLKEDAEFIFKHIDCDEVGKGVYAQGLTDYLELEISKEMDSIDETKSNIIDVFTNISEIINIPDYIEKAIIWACGGGEIDE